ncbi:Hypothetical predicted protein [Podarcis lilfordi]|uniref:Uncharacterized protein n=1 Tax=Podarcis lilfordi TaxID=74358 RepID=A0AA35NVH8_9SAUR|nr:Hypothetical predicted protein [Podarcis lilfordi]
MPGARLPSSPAATEEAPALPSPHPALPQPLTPLPPSPPPPPPGRSRSRLHPGARQPPRTPPPQFSNAASARARAASARRAAHCVSSGGLWLHSIYDNKLQMILYQENIISNFCRKCESLGMDR